MKHLLENWRKYITEDWRDTSWQNDDEKATIGDVIDYLGDETESLNVQSLSQQLPPLPTRGAKRVRDANLEFPIIVVKKDNQFQYVLDGNHRLQQAIDNKVETIKAKILNLDNPETPENFKRLFESIHLNEQRDQRPRKEPTPFKSKAQKRYKKKRRQNDIYSTISGHKNLKSGAPFNITPQRAGTDRLRFENTLLENIGRVERLSIFDFDETIAFTTGVINVVNKETGETFQTKSQEEYDAIKDDDKYEFDFSPLDQVNDATENPNITSILRERLSDPNTQVMVLTARAPVSIDDIHRTLRTFDKPIETSDIIMIGVEGQNKGNYLANVILSKYDNIQEIEFYDDSQGNIDDMIQIKKELESIDRQIKFNIYLVKHGTPELVSG